MMELECKKNIVDLHVFIESWLKGTIDKSKQNFRYFENELDDKFNIVSPNGSIQTKQEIVSDFWNAYGVQSKNFKITILDIKVRFISKNSCTMTYIEVQKDVVESARISTAIFQKTKTEANAKNCWIHLHETWLNN